MCTVLQFLLCASPSSCSLECDFRFSLLTYSLWRSHVYVCVYYSQLLRAIKCKRNARSVPSPLPLPPREAKATVRTVQYALHECVDLMNSLPQATNHHHLLQKIACALGSTEFICISCFRCWQKAQHHPTTQSQPQTNTLTHARVLLCVYN